MPTTKIRKGPANKLAVNLRGMAVGYTRVSTAGQGEKGSSLEAQRVAIEAFAEARGLNLIEVFADVASGVSARSFYDRKTLQSALNLAVQNDAVLIVWDWDRLSRHANFEKQAQTVLPDARRIICAKDGMNMLDASRAATLAHAEHAAKRIARKTKEGMGKLKAQGVTFGNPDIRTNVQPMGTAAYSNMRQKHELEILEVLRKLPDPMGITRAQAAEILNQKGLRTLQNKEWTKSRVTEPLQRARAILRAEENAKVPSIPNFGLF